MQTKKISPFKKKGANKRKRRESWPKGRDKSPPAQDLPVTLEDLEQLEEDDDL